MNFVFHDRYSSEILFFPNLKKNEMCVSFDGEQKR